MRSFNLHSIIVLLVAVSLYACGGRKNSSGNSINTATTNIKPSSSVDEILGELGNEPKCSSFVLKDKIYF